jgi:hypothetical protein
MSRGKRAGNQVCWRDPAARRRRPRCDAHRGTPEPSRRDLHCLPRLARPAPARRRYRCPVRWRRGGSRSPQVRWRRAAAGGGATPRAASCSLDTPAPGGQRLVDRSAHPIDRPRPSPPDSPAAATPNGCRQCRGDDAQPGSESDHMDPSSAALLRARMARVRPWEAVLGNLRGHSLRSGISGIGTRSGMECVGVAPMTWKSSTIDQAGREHPYEQRAGRGEGRSRREQKMDTARSCSRGS